MFADYYEKYKGTPKFGMSEQQKLEAQARLEGLKNAYMMNIWNARSGTQKDIAANKTGSTVDESGNITPLTDPSKMAPTVAATIAEKGAKTTEAGTASGVNTSRKALLDSANQITQEALSGGGSSVDSVDANGNPTISTKPKANMVVSGVTSRGPTVTNMDAVAQKAAISAAVNPWHQQNAKVDAGLHALRVMDQGFDGKNGQFDISKMNFGELNQNLGAIIAGQGQSSDAKVEGVRQSSLQGDVNQKIGYILGTPVNVVTPDIAKNLHKTLIGQIKQSAIERQPYAETLGNPKQNNPDDYFRESPSYQYYYPNENNPAQGGAANKLQTLTRATGQATGADDPLTAFKKRYPSAFGS